jgi:hypothetical protein
MNSSHQGRGWTSCWPASRPEFSEHHGRGAGPGLSQDTEEQQDSRCRL